ncbi:MAG: galactoside ABC transporter permease [Treponema sp.]|nr:galactoside ABC transporter permease [Treponema sp.]
MANYLEDDIKLKEYSSTLTELRKNGVDRISELKQEIAAAKRNKLLAADAREKIITEAQSGIAAAKKIAVQNRKAIASLQKEAVDRSNKLAKKYLADARDEEKKELARLHAEYDGNIAAIKAEFTAKRTAVSASYDGKSSRADAAAKNEELDIIQYELKSALFDAKSKYASDSDRVKSVKNQAYVNVVQKNRSLRNGTTRLSENLMLGWQNYLYQFKLSTFFLKNGLYIAILIFFVVCFIVAPVSGNGNLLTLPNIFTILEQASVRMFYALGVAGLILIAGTDLSVGRMVAMGAVITGLILHPGINIVTFFHLGPWDFTAIPTAGRIGMALGTSVILCVLFSCFAGVFTARLKIHPFISTLSTQLIIYGLLFFGTSGTPVGSIDADIKNMLGGRWELGYIGGDFITFPKLILPAIIAIFIAWFIWNKTTFGKNMYAVGGNSEAASVSGISVFRVTMGIFAMAGVFYGFGSFLEAFKANASAGTGQGYELDAIAACVVGGISFSGGIGKISGAVTGVIIFTGLTYCLTFLGIDTNLQFVFKGLILITAVALDSIKYLKRK